MATESAPSCPRHTAEVPMLLVTLRSAGSIAPDRPGGALRVPGMRRRAPASGGAELAGTAGRGRVDAAGGSAGHAGAPGHASDLASPWGGGVPRALEPDSASPAPELGGRGFFCVGQAGGIDERKDGRG